jgi:hypothetical protein
MGFSAVLCNGTHFNQLSERLSLYVSGNYSSGSKQNASVTLQTFNILGFT